METISAAEYQATIKKNHGKKYKTKYGNVQVKQDDVTFDSKAEQQRYRDLKVLERAGQIKNLRVHNRWNLHVNDIIIGRYETDFEYESQGKIIVEDVKGFMTPLSKWKIAHFQAQYPHITFKLIKA